MPDWTVEELSHRIVAESQDAIIYADSEGVIQLWNSGAEVMFGHPAATAVGQTLDLIIPENLRGRHWEGYDRVMGGGETKYGRELLSVPGIRADGSRISLEFSIAMLHDAGGQVAGIAAVLRDVTERRQVDRELRQRLAALESEVRPA